MPSSGLPSHSFPTPGGQEYHTHEYNPTMIPTSVAVSILRAIEDDLAPIAPNAKKLHRAINKLAFEHGLRLK